VGADATWLAGLLHGNEPTIITDELFSFVAVAYQLSATVRPGLMLSLVLLTGFALGLVGIHCRRSGAAPTASAAPLAFLAGRYGATAAAKERGPRFGAFTIPFKRSAPPPHDVDTALAIATLSQRAGLGVATDQHDYALGLLLTGNVDEAIALLERLVRRPVPSAQLWSDLSGAYVLHAASMRAGEHEYWFRGLDAALRATRLGSVLAGTLVNKSLSLEGAGLHELANPAAAAGQSAPSPTAEQRWTDLRTTLDGTTDANEVERVIAGPLTREFAQWLKEYLDDDVIPAWAEASTRGDRETARKLFERATSIAHALERNGDRLPARTAATLAQSASCPALLSGHIAFGQGRRAYDVDRFAAAEQHLRQAAADLSSCGSAFADAARMHQSLALFNLRRLSVLVPLLEGVAQRIDRQPFPNLQARVQWTLGAADFQQGRIEMALRRLERALAIYEQTGEAENAMFVAATAADVLRQLGDQRGAWLYLSRGLRHFPRSRVPLRQYVPLLIASMLTETYDLPYASLYLQDRALDVGRKRGIPGIIAEGLTRRASLRLKLDDPAGAAADLDLAGRELRRIIGPAQVTSLTAGATVVHAQIAGITRPDEAAGMLEGAIAASEASHPARIPRLFLQLGRLAVRRASWEAARKYFDDGIARFEQRRAGVDSLAHRASFLDDGWDLYAERIEVLRAIGASQETLLAETDRLKGRSLRQPRQKHDRVAPLASLRAALRPDDAVVSYAMLPSCTLLWLVTRDGIAMHQLAITPEELRTRVTEYRNLLAADTADRAVAAPGSDEAIEQLGRELFDALLGPVMPSLRGRTRLLIAPDGVLHALPFAPLLRPDRKYLIEQLEIITVPNLDALVQAGPTADITRPARAALVVGDPVVDRARFPYLPALLSAGIEARSVAAHYGSSIVQLGAAATPASFHEAAEQVDIIHFAGHAIENVEYPWRSALLLTGTADDSGLVFGEEIARWRLSRVRLVVLAACQTGFGRVFRGYGAISLATPFLVAGASSVVATLWNVEDDHARLLFETFHQRQAAGDQPSQALRQAQLLLLTHHNPALRSPRVWGPYVTIGGAGLRRVR
jgi:CHAT domain-containing protein